MTRRYYHPDLPRAGGLVRLSDAESQHAIRVMRVQVGDEIELFDGRGQQAAAVIRDIDRRHCQCESAAPEVVDREPELRLELGIALPKPDRARELIERLTELGVKAVTPIVASRTQRPPSASLLDRLRRGSIEACKQSGRNVIVQIDEPIQATEFFASSSADASRWIAHPSGAAVDSLAEAAGNHVIGAIGPEGGWTTEELEDAEAQRFAPVGLGKRILRVETAATYLAARLLD